MANVLHGSACTTPRIRAELQRSKVETSTLVQRYGLNRTTATKLRPAPPLLICPWGQRSAEVLDCKGEAKGRCQDSQVSVQSETEATGEMTSDQNTHLYPYCMNSRRNL